MMIHESHHMGHGLQILIECEWVEISSYDEAVGYKGQQVFIYKDEMR